MERKPEKIQAYRDSNPDLCDTSAVPVQVEIEMNCCKNMPYRKDWSIFCFDLADDLVPFKTKSAKTRLENDGLLIGDH